MSRGMNSAKLPSMQPSSMAVPTQYFAANSQLYDATSWPSHAPQPHQPLYNPYQQNGAESMFTNVQFPGGVHAVPQFASNDPDENASYLHGTLNPPVASDLDQRYSQQHQAHVYDDGSHHLTGTPSGRTESEAEGSPAESASNDGITVEGDEENEDDDGEGSSSKLEKSRQSARECRARKKLRYQYLESLVDARKQSVAQLKEELGQFEQYAKLYDKGEMPAGLLELLDDKTTASNQPMGETVNSSKTRQSKVSSKNAVSPRRPGGRVTADVTKPGASTASSNRTKRLSLAGTAFLSY